MFANVNGTRLYYERHGSGGPTLLFIHGTTLDHRMWRAQVEALAPRFDVITYDVRGFGQSALPAGPFRHYQDAEALLDLLGVRRAVVVGHSSGGLYALELALARPDLVAGCGLISAGLGGGAPFPADLKALVGKLRAAAAEGGVEAARAIWQSCILFAAAREKPPVRDELDAMLAGYSGWYWLHDSPAGNLAPPVHERLESIAVPVLVVDGGRDHPYNHAIADTLAQRIPRATLLRLPNAGHMANMEEPAAVTRALEQLAALALA
jgi:pimeloyl-ACP methyl ester carboxylesterase